MSACILLYFDIVRTGVVPYVELARVMRMERRFTKLHKPAHTVAGLGRIYLDRTREYHVGRHQSGCG